MAINDSYSTNEDTPLNVTAPGVLANDTDADGNTLTVAAPRPASGPSHGTLTLNANGSFSYTPAANYNGPDSFTYNANDGTVNSASAATVSITVNAVNDAPLCSDNGLHHGRGHAAERGVLVLATSTARRSPTARSPGRATGR